jgi:hypothetical protein
LLTVGFNPVNSAYVQALASGPAGTGTFMTPSGRGSVIEIDNMLVQMWNTYRLSPTVIYVNAQEQKNITNKCLTNASGPLIRYNVAADGDNGGPYGVSASGVVRWYYNPFSVDAGFDIPVKVHPDLPPGTILAYCERLPVWYQSNQTPNVRRGDDPSQLLPGRLAAANAPPGVRRLYRRGPGRICPVRRRHPHQHRQRLRLIRAQLQTRSPAAPALLWALGRRLVSLASHRSPRQSRPLSPPWA